VLYNAGRAALLGGDIEHGQAYLIRSVNLDPNSPAARDLGLLLSRQGRVVEAYSLLRPWTLHHADDGDARLVAATLAISLERPREAEQLLTGLVESPAVQLMHARARVQLGDAAGALKALQPALAQHPPAIDLEVRRAAAEAYLLAGQGAKAVEQLAGKTGNVPALVLLLAQAQRQAGNSAAAMTTLAPLAGRLPDNPDTVPDPRPAAGIAFEYGQLLLAANKRDEGLAMLQKSTRLYPLDRDAWEALAAAYEGAGRAADAKQARAQLQQLSAAPPGAVGAAPAGTPAVPAYVEAVVALMKQGKTQEALDLVRRRLAAAPDDLLAHGFEVRLLMARKEFAAALKAAEAAVAVAPRDPNTVYQRGAVKMAMNDLGGAEKDLRQALVLAPGHTAAMSDLAVLLMNAGKRDEARGLLEQVLRINPGDKVAAANLEQLKKELH
jgi:tetratricopeptide (TPR) repeat protein